MKKCIVCNKEYDDSKMFCPTCGNQLTSVTPASMPTTTTAAPAEPNADSSPTWFSNWGGTLLTFIGLIVCYELDALLGCVIAVIGLAGGLTSKNIINKVLSVILCVITIALVIRYFPYLF